MPTVTKHVVKQEYFTSNDVSWCVSKADEFFNHNFEHGNATTAKM